MIREVNEYLASAAGSVQDSAVSTSNLSGVSLENAQEVCGVHIVTFVVNIAPSIDVIAIGLVVHFSRNGVLGIVGNIIESHSDDVGGGEPAVLESLIGVANVSLVAVIPEAIGASN